MMIYQEWNCMRRQDLVSKKSDICKCNMKGGVHIFILRTIAKISTAIDVDLIGV